LHWRLAREGGLEERPREDLRPSWDKVGIHGVSRPRRWDAVVAAEAPELRGDAVEFVVLADGTLIVSDDQEGDLTTLADALEAQLQAPYRAEGVRQHDQVWAVAGRGIETLTFAADGEEIELTEHGGERALVVDGAHAFGSIPELEAVGRRHGDAYVVRARRIDGDLWEVATDPL
jgi:hypothetical protein